MLKPIHENKPPDRTGLNLLLALKKTCIIIFFFFHFFNNNGVFFPFFFFSNTFYRKNIVACADVTIFECVIIEIFTGFRAIDPAGGLFVFSGKKSEPVRSGGYLSVYKNNPPSPPTNFCRPPNPPGIHRESSSGLRSDFHDNSPAPTADGRANFNYG